MSSRKAMMCVLNPAFCFCVDASGMIKFWHYTSGSCLRTLDEKRQTLSAVFDAPGFHFYTVGANTDLHMYDFETKQHINTYGPR